MKKTGIRKSRDDPLHKKATSNHCKLPFTTESDFAINSNYILHQSSVIYKDDCMSEAENHNQNGKHYGKQEYYYQKKERKTQ